MNEIKLTRLHYDNCTINFKKGVNYIVGPNASGKTTIFLIMQYVLGLVKEINLPSEYITGDVMSLELIVKDESYIFRRIANSREIEVVNKSESLVFSVNSMKYQEYLFDMFSPKFENELNKSSIIAMLKACFIGENSSATLKTIRNRELNSLLLGVNTMYVKNLRQDVQELENEIRFKGDALSQIQQFKNDVSFTIKRELPDVNYDKIAEILMVTYSKYDNQYLEYQEVYKKSNNLLSKLKEYNGILLENKLQLLSSKFVRFLSEFSLDQRFSIFDIIDDKKQEFIPYSINDLLITLFHTTVQSSTNDTNGVGLIVDDLNSSFWDKNWEIKFQKLVDNISKHDSLQYIRFIHDPSLVDRASVVFETKRGGRYA